MKMIFFLSYFSSIISKFIAKSFRVWFHFFFTGLIAVSFFIFQFEGCKKNNPTSPPSDQNMLQGNQAFHASAVASYQSVGAGVSYPFKALQISSPSNSLIHNKAIINNLIHSFGSSLNKNSKALDDSLEFISYLNLYGGVSFSGNTITMPYYSDALGTQSAGSVKITLPTNVTNASDPTSYASYPATLLIDINITDGNLPCKGNIQIIYTGESGANKMTGTNTLTRDNVEFTLDLALDDDMNTTGSITIKESGATILATNVKGKVFETLNCDVNISPYNWTGTGTLNLLMGSVSLNINTDSGISTAASDSLGNLNINYGDGTKEIVEDALSSDLTGSGTKVGPPENITAASGSSQSAIVNTAFALPLVATVTDKSGNPVSGVDVKFTSPSSGQSCTFSGGGNSKTVTTNSLGQASVNVAADSITGNYKVTAEVSGVTSTAEFSLTNNSFVPVASYEAPLVYSFYDRIIKDINNNGQSIGYDMSSSSGSMPVYWLTPNSQQQTIQSSSNDSLIRVGGLNDNSQIVGNSYDIDNNSGSPINNYNPKNALYWSSPSSKPQKLKVPANTVFSEANDINNNGQIVGRATIPSSQNLVNNSLPLYWPSPTEAPIVLKGLNGADPSGEAILITSNGQIIGNAYTDSMTVPVVWSSPTASPVIPFTSSGGKYSQVESVNSSGKIVGESTINSYHDSPKAVTWASPSSPAQGLPFTSGAGADWISSATSINSMGVIVGGESETDDINYRGVIWQNGQAYDLNDLSNYQSDSKWIGEATLITDNGWILGAIGPNNATIYQYFLGESFPKEQYILIPKQ